MIKEFLVSDEIQPTHHIAPDLQIYMDFSGTYSKGREAKEK